MPTEVGVKVTLSVKKESGETDSKSIPLKDFKSPNEAGTPEFWEDVLGFVAKYRLRQDTKQSTLEAGSKEAKKAADAVNKSIGEQLKTEKEDRKKKPKKDDTTEPETSTST